MLFALLIKAQKNLNVSVNKSNNTITISNGLLSIVIPSESAYAKGKPCPAPIQSFIYADGSFSDNTFNELTAGGKLTGMKVKIVNNSNTQVTAKIEYSFIKSEFKYSDQVFTGAQAGAGFYNCSITVKKGEKSILIEEDSNNDIEYQVKISGGLLPDKARYRGWSSSDTIYGYEAPGKVYRSEIDRGYPMDATIDLAYTRLTNYPQLVLWEPAGGEQNSGRYWQVFNSTAGSNSNIFGFFQGRPSRLIGGRSVGVNLQTSPKSDNGNEQKTTSIVVNLTRRGPDNVWYPRKRFQWAAFISSKADIMLPEKQQPIANELNRISGLGSVVLDYFNKPVKLIPAFYKGSVYLPSSSIQAIYKRVKVDENFYKNLLQIDHVYKDIWQAWRFRDSAISIKKMLLKYTDDLVVEYQKGEGTYLQTNRYWKGSNSFKYYAILISALFADSELDISDAEKTKLEHLVALMARIMWDNNNVPMFDSAGVNFGPENMTHMYNNSGRIFFALLLANDPEFKNRARDAVASINNEIEKAIYANGSSTATPHYIQPTIEPILFSMLQLKQAAVVNLFKVNKKIELFATFYSQLLTPPSVRFSQNRKLISFGDGSEESAATFALLGTGLSDINPSLSKELFSFFWHGPMRGSLFGSLGLAVNLVQNPVDKFTVSSSNYVGYDSHFRAGLNTKNETALWVLNGDALSDHRNDDAGEMAIYALGAPLSLSRSSFYYPSATDARIRSVVIPEVLFPEWNKTSQPIAERSLTNRTWPKSESLAFVNLGYSTSTSVKMSNKEGKTWFRKINMLSIFNDNPIFTFYDSVSENESSIWSMPMMSNGIVHSSTGNIVPQQKVYNNSTLKNLPAATPVKQMQPGLNQFTFIGQDWPIHYSKGINWQLYSLSDKTMDFTASDWTTTWQNTIEVNEFLATNGTPYFEREQIIRLRSTKPFFLLLLPYAKGSEDPYTNHVISKGNHIFSINYKGNTILADPESYIVKSPQRFYAALLSEKGQLEDSEISIKGGSTELLWEEKKVIIKVHGNSGKRIINLPFLLKAEQQKEVSFKYVDGRTNIIIDYNDAAGLNLASGDKGYKEYNFKVQ